MEKKHPLGARGKVLEDLFYFEQDLTLLEKKQQLRDLERNLKTYSEISGITNEAILRKLAELQVRVETLATLSVIPLVEVAWADGKIEDPEREAILKEAESCGVFQGPVTRNLFEHSLIKHPPKGLLDSWIFYMQGLSALLGKADRRELKAVFLKRARRIAEAESGVNKPKTGISRRAEEVLCRIEQAFEPLSYQP